MYECTMHIIHVGKYGKVGKYGVDRKTIERGRGVEGR